MIKQKRWKIMKEKTILKGIRMTESLIEKIEKSAKKEERNFSAQVIYIIKKYYELQEKDQ